MPFCSNCGQQLQEGAKFCPNCGAATQQISQQAAQPSREESEEDIDESMNMVLNLCEDDPDAGLYFIEQSVKNKPELKFNPFVKFARAIAYGSKGLFQLLRSKSGIDWTTFDEEELRENLGITDAHLDCLEKGLQEIKEMEEIHPEALKIFVIENEMGKSKVDAMAIVLERCRPGRVQELLGKTKLLYFGPSRIFIHNDCKITREEWFVFSDIFFTSRKVAKSAILRFDSRDDKGRRYLNVVLYTETNPLTAEFAGFLCLYDDGTFIPDLKI